MIRSLRVPAATAFVLVAIVLAGALTIGGGKPRSDHPAVGRREPAVDGIEHAIGAPTLLYFWADWCAKCRVQTPVVESVRTSVSPLCGNVVALEDRAHAEAFTRYGVRVLPTIVVVAADGRETTRFVGDTTKEQIVASLAAAGGSC